MSTELDRAATALFPEAGPARIRDVKFYGGRRRIVTAEELAAQLLRADAQVREGVARRVEDLDGEAC